MVKPGVLIVTLWALSFAAYAQPQTGGQNRVWVFGDSVVMNFEGDSIRIDSLSSHAFYLENCAAICDSSGLVLYMNDDSIFNKNHQGIAATVDSMKWNETVTQGSMILPRPGHEFQYYCLYLSYYNHGIFDIDCKLYYSLVDLRLNAGEGGLIEQNIELEGCGLLAEKLNATRHANGKDWWVAVHGSENDSMYTLLLNENGIRLNSVQAMGSDFGNIGGPGMGEMTFSEQGDKIVWVNVIGTIDIATFDRCNGVLALMDSFSVLGSGLYGLSFSPNGRYLYVSEWGNSSSAGQALFQFDMLSSDIQASQRLIYRTSNELIEFFQHQIGPDNKIYLAGLSEYAIDSTPASNSRFLSVIGQPDSAGVACDFQYKKVSLGTRYCWAGLPNQPNYDLGPMAPQVAQAGPDRSICQGDTIQLGSSAPLLSGVSAQWTSSLPTWIEQTDSLATKIAPSSSGWFYLTVTDSALGEPCGVSMDSVYVTVEAPLTLPALSDVSVCAGVKASIGFAPRVNEVYAWSPVEGLSDAFASMTEVEVGSTMAYILTVTDTTLQTSCKSATTSQRVVVNGCDLPSIISGNQSLVFRGYSGTVSLTVYDMAGRLIYQNKNYTNELNAEQLSAGIYWYEVVAGPSTPSTGSGTVGGRRKLLVGW